MINRLRFALLIFWLSIGSYTAIAQGTFGNTPLSRQPFGEYVGEGFSRNKAMGGAAIANPSGEYINIENPALLWYNRTANIEGVLQGQIRNVSDKNNFQRSGGAIPVNFGLAFPVNKYLSMAFGIKPMTSVDYNIRFTNPVPASSDTVIYRVKGSGGLSKVFLGAGYNLGKGFTAGVEGSLQFGNVITNREVQFYGSFEPIANLQTTNRYIGLNLKPGLAFRKALDSAKTRYLSFGLVYDLGFNSDLTQKSIFQLQNYDALPYFTDTLGFKNGQKVGTPSTISFGICYQRQLHNTIALDVALSNWTKYTDPSGSGTKVPNTVRVGLGYEFIPNIYSSKYVNIMAYRFGVSYKTEPLELNNKQVNDIRISTGVGFPIIRKEARYMRPFININLFVGQRAGLSAYNLQEQYFGASIGITLNDTQWFRRFRLE